MYCESKIEHNSYFHTEHIKPKSKFPELKFTWDNLGYSCQICNTNKSDKFEEDIRFINPYDENPENYIVFIGHFVYPKQGSERGEYTIRELELNRAGLIERRIEKINNINNVIKYAFRTKSESLRNKAISELKKEADKDKEYSAMVKCLLLVQNILTKKEE
jgi:hypothetical protein